MYPSDAVLEPKSPLFTDEYKQSDEKTPDALSLVHYVYGRW